LVFRYFAGKNNYEAADNGGSAGHKEINRTTLTKKDIVQGLKQMLYKNSLKSSD
jgi:sucrose phosphorylase